MVFDEMTGNLREQQSLFHQMPKSQSYFSSADKSEVRAIYFRPVNINKNRRKIKARTTGFSCPDIQKTSLEKLMIQLKVGVR
jgi:hypothetical protein